MPGADTHDLGTIAAALVALVLSIVSSGLLFNAAFVAGVAIRQRVAGVAIRQREGEFVFYWPLGWKRVLLQSGLSVGADETTFRSKFGLIERVSGVNAGMQRLIVKGAGQKQWSFPTTLLREDADVIVKRMSEVLDNHAAPPP